jgi:glycine/D-amino acid oxidase-like deaminating enzyme
MCDHGRDVTLLDGAAVAERLPGHDADDVAVGALARDAACVYPAADTEAGADRAADAGATIRTGTPVALAESGTTVETPDGPRSFDAVLLAAGAHSRDLLADVSVPIPVKPYRVQACQTGSVATDLPIWYDATESYYARPRDGGLLVGDGTEEREADPDAYDRTADDDFVSVSLDRVTAAVGERPPVDRAWAGVCTATPDRNPLVGPVERDGLFVATGWHGHGFMRAPALGETVAGQIRGGDGIDAFDPRRFEGDEEFAVIEGMTVE